ncbi:HEPN domain-containing protein [Methanobacterium ferruginis]|uniref:HEPN domain-containing protein n=1 Tax=Methanobacterium ferruginis TaxID=710191 RepID=UPI002573346B|nr:HEPN domain-containing protein [Methanobacterium ferruginis]MCC7550188.1 HEPN domain-containing protein [Methanobacterium sp.]BDZ68814.1 hypothetical protein GCM10025860_22620 [Methanobacterium ferruginis]
MNKIDELCYQGHLKKVEPSPLKSALSLKEAKIWLKEAEKTFEEGYYRSSRVSTYFASLHAVRAVSLRDGIQEENSFYLIDYMEKYVAEGKIKKECIDILNWVFDFYYQDQHHFQSTRNPQDLQQAIRYCQVFIENIKLLLDKTAKLPRALVKNTIKEDEFVK